MHRRSARIFHDVSRYAERILSPDRINCRWNAWWTRAGRCWISTASRRWAKKWTSRRYRQILRSSSTSFATWTIRKDVVNSKRLISRDKLIIIWLVTQLLAKSNDVAHCEDDKMYPCCYLIMCHCLLHNVYIIVHVMLPKDNSQALRYLRNVEKGRKSGW